MILEGQTRIYFRAIYFSARSFRRRRLNISRICTSAARAPNPPPAEDKPEMRSRVGHGGQLLHVTGYCGDGWAVPGECQPTDQRSPCTAKRRRNNSGRIAEPRG